MNQEPQLCPDCPLSRKWKNEALWRIKQRQYTKAKTEPSALKLCMERRKILEEQGVECPYFPKSEDITKFFGSVKKLNPLQLWHLHRFCDKHGLDYQLVDSTLTYEENKKYLVSQAIDSHIEDRPRECKSQEEDYMKHHFLSHYVNCVNAGETRSEETGEIIIPGSHFSLAEWIQQHPHFLGWFLHNTYKGESLLIQLCCVRREENGQGKTSKPSHMSEMWTSRH